MDTKGIKISTIKTIFIIYFPITFYSDLMYNKDLKG